MFKKLQRYISSCEACQQEKQKRGKIPYFHPRIPLSYYPNSYISADIKYMPKDMNMLCTIISSFSTNHIILYRSSPKDHLVTQLRSMHGHHRPMHA